MNFRAIRVFFFDLDGVLSIGKENPQYLGGRELIAKIKSLGRKTSLLTNDSTHTRTEIQQTLSKLGFSFDLQEILTSSYLTALYLTKRFEKAGFFLVGEEGFDVNSKPLVTTRRRIDLTWWWLVSIEN